MGGGGGICDQFLGNYVVIGPPTGFFTRKNQRRQPAKPKTNEPRWLLHTLTVVLTRQAVPRKERNHVAGNPLILSALLECEISILVVFATKIVF